MKEKSTIDNFSSENSIIECESDAAAFLTIFWSEGNVAVSSHHNGLRVRGKGLSNYVVRKPLSTGEAAYGLPNKDSRISLEPTLTFRSIGTKAKFSGVCF